MALPAVSRILGASLIIYLAVAMVLASKIKGANLFRKIYLIPIAVLRCDRAVATFTTRRRDCEQLPGIHRDHEPAGMAR